MDYNEGKKVGLRTDDMNFIKQLLESESKDDSCILSRFTTGALVNLMLYYPECKSFIENLISKRGKRLNSKKVYDFLKYEIENPYFDPDYGFNVYRQQKARELLEEMGDLEYSFEDECTYKSNNKIQQCLDVEHNIKESTKSALTLDSDDSFDKSDVTLSAKEAQQEQENIENKMLIAVNETSIFYKLKLFFRNLFSNKKAVGNI